LVYVELSEIMNEDGRALDTYDCYDESQGVTIKSLCAFLGGRHTFEILRR